MKLYKIIDSVIPTMLNKPCKIAIFTDGFRCKVFQKDFGFWQRNYCLEMYITPQRIERKIYAIEEDGKMREALRKRLRENGLL